MNTTFEELRNQAKSHIEELNERLLQLKEKAKRSVGSSPLSIKNREDIQSEYQRVLKEKYKLENL
jgi:DNA-binding ferritin-like protein